MIRSLLLLAVCAVSLAIMAPPALIVPIAIAALAAAIPIAAFARHHDHLLPTTPRVFRPAF